MGRSGGVDIGLIRGPFTNFSAKCFNLIGFIPGNSFRNTGAMSSREDSYGSTGDGGLTPTETSVRRPPRPLSPPPGSCCGSGCASCVYDVYEQEKRIWDRKGAASTTAALAGEGMPHLSPDDYSQFFVAEVESVTASCYLFKFTAVEKACFLSIKVGQHVILRGIIGDVSVTRQYTPIRCDPAERSFHVVIKVYADGLMSSYVKTLSVGTITEWRGPFGDFTYVPNQASKLILLAAGTGIAPMVRLIEGILDDDDDETRMKLLYSCKTLQAILMRPLLYKWQKYWNFTAKYFLSQEPHLEDWRPYGEDVVQGRITKEALSLELSGSRCRFLICGSKTFNADMTSHILELGFSQDCLHLF